MNKRLLSLLACPGCKGSISVHGQSYVQCIRCGRKYTCVKGIPVMIDMEHLPEHLKNQIVFFHKEASSYAKTHTVESWQKKYLERLFKMVGYCKGKIFIDDACGSGYISIEAAKRGAFVISCDLNMAALLRLQGIASLFGLSARIFPVCCSAESLPLKNDISNVLVANAILEHLPKEQDAIREITRVSKKGALTMITVPIAYHLLNPLLAPLNYLHDKRIGHLRRYTKESLVAKFRSWKLMTVHYTGHTQKVIKTLINEFIPLFDKQKIEEEDELLVSKELFATNVSILFSKKI